MKDFEFNVGNGWNNKLCYRKFKYSNGFSKIEMHTRVYQLFTFRLTYMIFTHHLIFDDVCYVIRLNKKKIFVSGE